MQSTTKLPSQPGSDGSIWPLEEPGPRATRWRLAGGKTSARIRKLLDALALQARDALCSPQPFAALRTLVVGRAPLQAAANKGQPVVLATFGPQEAEDLVRALATRVNACANAACAIVVRMDAPQRTVESRQVRVFGQPFELADTAAFVALALRAPIFPVFAEPAQWGLHRVHVDEPFLPRGKSDVALQRTGQRMAWALERFARRTTSYEAVLGVVPDESEDMAPPVSCHRAFISVVEDGRCHVAPICLVHPAGSIHEPPIGACRSPEITYPRRVPPPCLDASEPKAAGRNPSIFPSFIASSSPQPTKTVPT